MKLKKLAAALALSVAVSSIPLFGGAFHSPLNAAEKIESGVVVKVDGQEVQKNEYAGSELYYDIAGFDGAEHNYEIAFLSDAPPVVVLDFDVSDEYHALWEGDWDFSSGDTEIKISNVPQGADPPSPVQLALYGQTGDLVEKTRSSPSSCILRLLGEGTFRFDCKAGKIYMYLTSAGKGNISFKISKTEEGTDSEPPQDEPELPEGAVTLTDSYYDVSVSGMFPDGAYIDVDRGYGTSSLNDYYPNLDYNKYNYEKYSVTVYDKYGIAYQPPDGTFKVKLPIRYLNDRIESLNVFRSESDGRYTKMDNAIIKDNAFIFTTDRLGAFIISDRPLDDTTVQFTESENPRVIATAKYNDVLGFWCKIINIDLDDSDPEQLVIDMYAHDNNSKEVDINGNVHVKVHLDDNFLPDKRENLKVFRYDSDGNYTEMNATIEKDNYIVFDTDRLGYFGIFDPQSTVTLEYGDNTTDEDLNEYYKTILSVSGPREYLWKIGSIYGGTTHLTYPSWFTIKSNGWHDAEQPAGAVEVKMYCDSVKDSMKIFRKENGSYINMNARIEGNTVIFTTDRFGKFRYTEEDLDKRTTLSDNSTGVYVNGSLPDNAKIETESTQTTDQLSYEVTLKDKDGNIIQPTSKIEVSLPIPDSFINPPAEATGLYGLLSAGLDFEAKADIKAVSDLKVFRDEGNGKYIKMNASYENNAMVFETDKFGTFVITERQLSDEEWEDTTTTEGSTTPTPTPTPPYVPSYPSYPGSGWNVPSSTTAATATATTSVTAAATTAVSAENTQTTVSEPAATALSSTNSTTAPPAVSSETVPSDTGSANTSNATNATNAVDKDKNISTGVALSAVPVLISAVALSLSRKKKK